MSKYKNVFFLHNLHGTKVFLFDEKNYFYFVTNQRLRIQFLQYMHILKSSLLYYRFEN